MKNPRNVTRYRGTHCLNCEQPLELAEKYCSNCGQLNSTKKLAFDDFFNEFFAGIFAYDSRLRRTLKSLILRPGKISRDYIEGKRMRYANPFRFYLSASIIFFIIWSSTKEFGGITPENSPADEIENLSEEELEKLRQDLKTVPSIAASPVNVDSLITNQRENASKTFKDFYISQEGLDSLGLASSLQKQYQLYDHFHDETGVVQSAAALDSLNHTVSTYNEWVYKKTVDVNILEKNPQLFLDYFINKLPFIIFFYLPIFALFIWLLYVRRPFNYMEHLIFAFHVQTTFFVVMGFALLLDIIFDTSYFSGIIILLFLFYLYKAMRRFYRQRRFKTIVKFILLNGIFFILAIAATIISVLASFAIY